MWKFKENPDLAHWTIIFGPVTQHLRGHQFYNKNNSGANFCHDNCKNLAKMRQAHQGAVGLCPKIMTLTWNNCASFCCCCDCHSDYERDTGNRTSWTVFFIFSLSCTLLISHSEVKFSCGIIVVEVWNSTYVVLIIKCVFMLKTVCFLRFFET